MMLAISIIDYVMVQWLFAKASNKKGQKKNNECTLARHDGFFLYQYSSLHIDLMLYYHSSFM